MPEDPQEPVSPTSPNSKWSKTSKSSKLSNQKRAYDVTEHSLALDDLVVEVKTSLNVEDFEISLGLSQEEVQRRLEQYGPNVLSPPKRTSELVKFLLQFTDPLLVMLGAAGLMGFICYGLDRQIPGNLYCGIALYVIIIVQCVISYLQERQSNSVMESLKKMVPAQCSVIRNGHIDRIPVADLVPGDLVKLKGGDRVPADIRIVKTNGLKVECSSLTGEPDAFEVTVEMTHHEPHESRNIAFGTSQCTEGTAYGVVVRTGNNTLIGIVAALASDTTTGISTLQLELQRVVKFIAGLGFLLALLVLIVGSLQKLSAVLVLNLVIAILVADVPQGLPATVTTSLAIAAHRMKEKHVLVKNLEIIETLGSTSCICSDKTGTLTMNKMSVQNLWVDGQIKAGSQVVTSQTDGDEKLLLIAAVCNAAKFLQSEQQLRQDDSDTKKDTREILGDASESALLRYCDSICPVHRMRDEYPKLYDLPFNSTNKFALCLVNLKDKPTKQLVMMKGAPEILLARCSTWLKDGQVTTIDDEFKTQFQDAYEHFAGNGERVLGFAQLEIDSLSETQIHSGDVPQDSLTFVGLISLLDPPKPGVDRAVLDCHSAGIKVFMVTGDHALTAEAIARQVNIITKKTRKNVAEERGISVDSVQEHDPEIEAVVVTGQELSNFREKDWKWLLDHAQIVFARTTPQQKLEIVERLQERGEVIAVTGDGVNDSPALKKADVGVSMGGPTASDVAREASDIIIMDDDFCSIVQGVREGRLVFDNLKKCISYTLSHMLAEILPVLLNIIFLLPLSLSPLLVLLIDLGSELVPGIAFAYEQPETTIMKRKPRNIKTDRLITAPMITYCYVIVGVFEAVTSMLCWFAVLWIEGIDISTLIYPSETYFKHDAAPLPSKFGPLDANQQLRILSEINGANFMGIVFSQMFHLWMCRTRATSIFSSNPFANKISWLAMIYELMFIFVLCYIPQMTSVFVSGKGIPGPVWLVPVAFGFGVLCWTELIKWAERRRLSGQKSCLAWFAW